MGKLHVASILASLVFVALAFGSAAPPPKDGQAPVLDGEPPAEPGTPQPPAPQTGKWKTVESVDPMTDAKVVGAQLTAEGEASLFSQLPTIMVRCRNNTSDILFDFHDGITAEFSGAEMVAPVQFRYDDGKPQPYRLGQSEGISTTYFSRRAVADAKDFIAHDKLLVGYTAALGGKTVYTTFDLRGASVALQPVRDACHW